MTTKLCVWKPVNAVARAKYPGCVALALDGCEYCAAHWQLVKGHVTKREKVHREGDDSDLLPYTDDEFKALAYLRERTK